MKAQLAETKTELQGTKAVVESQAAELQRQAARLAAIEKMLLAQQRGPEFFQSAPGSGRAGGADDTKETKQAKPAPTAALEDAPISSILQVDIKNTIYHVVLGEDVSSFPSTSFRNTASSSTPLRVCFLISTPRKNFVIMRAA